MASLFDLFNNSNAQDAANAQKGGIQQGLGYLSQYFGQGQNALTNNYTAALQPFMQNYQQGQQGTQALGDALGLGGSAGNQRATQAFWNNPAIQSQLDLGNQSVMRNNAATGNLASGATAVDLQAQGQKVASQGWQNYIGSLQPYLNYSQGAAGGIGSLYSGLGNALNANMMNLGNAYYGGATSMGNAQANADLANNQASSNMWGALGQGLGLGANLLGFLKLSDERAKEHIEPVGELYDGQTVYRYNYLDDPRTEIGLIAQEVERVEPEAVFDYGVGDLKGVDYGRATALASALHPFFGNDEAAMEAA